MIKLSLSALILLAASSSVFASTKTPVTSINLKNNETVNLSLSTHNPNRLFVKGEKITQAACQQSYCVASYDKSGGVYISLGYPARLSTNGFSIFIETDSGKHFSVLAKADNEATGKTVEFSVSGGTKKAHEFEKKNHYQAILVKLIKAMINYHEGDQLNYGLSTQAIVHREPQSIDVKGILIIPVRLFVSDNFKGYQVLVKNMTDKPIALKTKSFYEPSMVAGALEDTILKPKSSTYFYSVFEETKDA